MEGLSLATNNLLMKEVQDEARVKVILEKIQIFDDRDLFGKGEFRFSTRVHSRNFGGQYNEFEIPAEGYLSVSDKEGRDLNVEIFEGHLIDHLAIEITGAEYDTKKLKDDLTPYRRIFQGPVKHWLGSIGPSNEQIEPEILGSWAIWYRIEEI